MKKVTETKNPSDGVNMVYTVDVIDGEKLDTLVNLDAEFAISGAVRDEFAEELGDLIDKYRI
ncbi:MAG: hypothetical protein SVT56_13205 [Chloroflexota bacterium]|nr:hypothetical protein [Chloroflexota bacterium]